MSLRSGHYPRTQILDGKGTVFQHWAGKLHRYLVKDLIIKGPFIGTKTKKNLEKGFIGDDAINNVAE